MRHRTAFGFTVLVLTCILFFTGCFEDDRPIRLGFIGGLSGGNVDLSQAGRNGAMLAVEEANRAGGLNGRTIELVIRDDGNNKAAAAAAAQDLIQEKVDLIVGPFTTTMTEAVLSVTQPQKMIVFSPTASSTQFSGQDDYFFRLCSTSTDNAEDYADFMVSRRGYRRISMAVEQQNYTFAKTFTDAFKNKMQALGGELETEIWYDTRTVTSFADLVNKLIELKPDVVLLIANAVDVARIAQQFRKMDEETKIVAVEWAGTQQLIELGGKAVDGIEVLHLFNMFGQEERFVRFVEDYQGRFNTLPSFSSILAYDTVQAILKAIQGRKKGESLKQAILANGPYQGLQQTLVMDAYGDSRRKGYFVVVDGTQFVPAP